MSSISLRDCLACTVMLSWTCTHLSLTPYIKQPQLQQPHKHNPRMENNTCRHTDAIAKECVARARECRQLVARRISESSHDENPQSPGCKAERPLPRSEPSQLSDPHTSRRVATALRLSGRSHQGTILHCSISAPAPSVRTTPLGALQQSTAVTPAFQINTGGAMAVMQDIDMGIREAMEKKPKTH